MGDEPVTRIAFLGTGIMGAPMAVNLLQAGFPVTVWNRSRDKAERLVPLGAAVVDEPWAAVDGADVVITMLADGPAVTEVMFGAGGQGEGAARAVRPGALVIDMSSIPPPAARDHGRRLDERGIGYLDAPVSGGEVGAKARTLAIMAGGTAGDFERAAPIFAALGRAVHVGPVGSGQVAKLCNQLIVGVTIGAVAEALLLAEVNGADPAAVREALTGGFADSRILTLHGKRMIDRAFEPGAKVTTQTKDLDTVLAVAAATGLKLPFTGTAAALFGALAECDGGLDHSALLLELERINAPEG